MTPRPTLPVRERGASRYPPNFKAPPRSHPHEIFSIAVFQFIVSISIWPGHVHNSYRRWFARQSSSKPRCSSDECNTPFSACYFAAAPSWCRTPRNFDVGRFMGLRRLFTVTELQATATWLSSCLHRICLFRRVYELRPSQRHALLAHTLGPNPRD